MIYNEAVKIGDMHLIPTILSLYVLEGYEINRIESHEGGRNLV
jgi:hypothetical protein